MKITRILLLCLWGTTCILKHSYAQIDTIAHKKSGATTLPSAYPPTTQRSLEGRINALGNHVNSSAYELNPVLLPDRHRLYFTRRKHPHNTGGIQDLGDIWYAQQQPDGSFNKAQRLPAPLNDPYTSSIIGFTQNGEVMYLFYTVLEYGQKKSRIGRSRRLKSYPSASENPQPNTTHERWSPPENMQIPYFKNKSTRQNAYISPNENFILIEAESFHSYGNEDIYVSLRQKKGTWSPLINLKQSINTPYQEAAPFMMSDEKTLIFASNRPPNQGSWDLFYSTRLDDTWTRWTSPKALKNNSAQHKDLPGKKAIHPSTTTLQNTSLINTKAAEFSFFYAPEDAQAYFVRNRNSEERSEIMRILLTKAMKSQDPVLNPTAETTQPQIHKPLNHTQPSTTPLDAQKIRVVVVDADTGKPLQAKIYRSEPYQDTLYTLPHTTLSLPRPPPSYTATCSANGYWPKTISLDHTATQNQKQRYIALNPLKSGETIVLEHILFPQAKVDILPSAQEQLQLLLLMLQEHPQIYLFIAGHTDNQGDFLLNMQLSEQRMQAVKQYLIQHGITPQRLKGKGYGSTQPIASNKNEKGRKKNRRVSFTIIQP